MEDYLEAIVHLAARDGAARAGDIARRLKVRLPSVTSALKTLAAKKLIHYGPYRRVTLTPRGRDAGEGVARKHEVITDFLVKVLLMDPKEAARNARGMKHALSNEAMDRLLRFIEFMRFCPRGRARWTSGFGGFCADGSPTPTCRRCARSGTPLRSGT
jgi:DtxR family Mn-dependent transcriptional regulator